LARDLGNGSVYVRTDIMDEDSIAAAVRAATELGPLRAAVVVHGGPPPPGAKGPARVVNREGQRLPLSQFAHTVHVYLVSAFAVTSQAAEAMARTNRSPTTSGVIINTASIAGYEGQPGQSRTPPRRGGSSHDADRGSRLSAAGDQGGCDRAWDLPDVRLFLADDRRAAQAHWGPMVPNPKRMGDPAEYGILAAHIVENDFLNGTTIRLDGAQRF
jgi:NAD(P)-dependent dehydrogenase (short-subunit alcohol dehydrogenase family)